MVLSSVKIILSQIVSPKTKSIHQNASTQAKEDSMKDLSTTNAATKKVGSPM